MAESGIYVIVELGWEYDDQYYSRPESGGGTPKFWFKASEKLLAESEVERLNKESRKLSDARDYETNDLEDLDFYKLVFVPFHGPLPKFAKGQSVQFGAYTRGPQLIGTVESVRTISGQNTYAIETPDGMLYSPIQEVNMSAA